MTFQAKFARASQQLDALERDMDVWVATQPYVVASHNDSQSGEVVGVAIIKDDPPVDRWSLSMGECLHNFRSALDHLAYELTEANMPGGIPNAIARDVQFPIFGGPADLAKIQHTIRGIGPAAQAIIQTLQPHHRGDPLYRSDPLWVLQRLSNIDKHRQLNFTPPINNVLTLSDGCEVVFLHKGAVRHGAEVFRVRRTIVQTPRVEVNFNLTFHIGFGDIGAGVGGEPVIGVIQRIRDRIQNDVFGPLAQYLR